MIRLAGPLRSRVIVRLAVLILTAGGLSAATVTSAQASVPLNQNLLVDGGADAVTGGDGSTAVSPPGWTTTGGLTVISYATGNGYPTTSSPGPTDRGANFFGGGNTASSTATQTIDVSGSASAIDAGTISAQLAGWLGGYSSQADSASVTATFLNSSAASIGSTTIGPVTAADRNNTTGFVQKQSATTLPAGTRTVRVVLDAERAGGTSNDGYADSLSFMLGSVSGSGNLLVNPGADSGNCTKSGLDGLTVPGWTVTSGMPNVVCWGTWLTSATPGPSTRGTGYFTGGATGSSGLSQTVPVGSAAAAIDTGTVTYSLSGWLGGWSNSADVVALSASFLGSSGQNLGNVTVGPVSASTRGNTTELLSESSPAGATVPSGTRSIKVSLNFTWSSDSWTNTTDAYADNLSLTLSTPLTPLSLTPPTSAVPGYDHVFIVMMENEDANSATDPSNYIYGNPTAPYINNTLLPKGTALTNMYATTHPSDPNYLAIAAGSTLDLNSNPAVGSVNAANLGDRAESAGKSWKAYNDGATGNCDLTKHDPVYPDDEPFTLFSNVANDKTRCEAHIQPQTQFMTDLKSSATTPNFVWFAADDCNDMEGCGIAAGDTWLKNTLPAIFNSDAWTKDRSLLIVTWDEGYTKSYGPSYPNQVATVLIGSQNTVTAGATSASRYTHYSLGRTIDDALGLTPVTTNDQYAQPVNDAFTGS